MRIEIILFLIRAIKTKQVQKAMICPRVSRDHSFVVLSVHSKVFFQNLRTSEETCEEDCGSAFQ